MDLDSGAALRALDGLYTREQLVAFERAIDDELARRAYPHGWLCLIFPLWACLFLMCYAPCVGWPRARALNRVCAIENEKLAARGLVWAAEFINRREDGILIFGGIMRLVLSADLEARAAYEASHPAARLLAAELRARIAALTAAATAGERSALGGDRETRRRGTFPVVLR